MNGRAADNKAVEGIVGMGGKNVLKWFFPGAAIILAITGSAKVWTAFGSVAFLTVADPIVGISFRHLMLAVGVAELAIAALCLFTKAQRLATMLVAWLATNFLVYRIGLWWMDWHRPCNCLGNLTDALHVSPQLADNIMKAVLAYLLIGSFGLLIWEWTRRRSTLLRQDTGGSPSTPESATA
jgi:Methylamine utilisation protein MauE